MGVAAAQTMKYYKRRENTGNAVSGCNTSHPKIPIIHHKLKHPTVSFKVGSFSIIFSIMSSVIEVCLLLLTN